LTVQASRDPINPIVRRTADRHRLVLGSFVVIAPENYVANFDRLVRGRELSRLVRRRGAYRVDIDHYGRHTRTPFYRGNESIQKECLSIKHRSEQLLAFEHLNCNASGIAQAACLDRRALLYGEPRLLNWILFESDV
jgi:hypothetical protein